MKKCLLCLALCAALMLSSCSAKPRMSRYTYSFFGTFDTFVVLTAYAPDQQTFDRAAQLTESEFKRYHELFDAYRHSDTVNNLFDLNEGAWKAPMTVTSDMMELLKLCVKAQREIPDTVNIAMGRVLRLWHDAREHAEDDPLTAALPDMADLTEAAQHCDISDLILDPDAMTVAYADPLLRLDFGAVAKGFTAGKVAEEIRKIVPRFSLNAGGNIVTGDGPDNDLGLWKVGVQDPNAAIISDDNTYLTVLGFNNLSLVTSGDYQRYYTVDGVRYHHIIDPKTLMPATHVRAVSILTSDALMADYLSTAAFILPYEDSRALIESIGADALWVLPDDSVEMTDGFRKYVME